MTQNLKSLEDSKLFQDLAARYFLEDYQGQRGFSDMGQLLRAAKRAGLERDKLGLDLACGNGRPGLFIIRRLRCQLVGLDSSAEALAIAQHRAERYNLQDYVKYQQADLNQPLPFAAETFDGAIGVEQFDPFKGQARDPEKLYREVWRVLKPGGGLAFYFRVSSQPDTPWSLLPADHVTLLEKAGFGQTETFDVSWEFGALLARMQRAYEEKGVLDKLRATLGSDFADSLYNEVQDLQGRVNAGQLQRYLFAAKK